MLVYFLSEIYFRFTYDLTAQGENARHIEKNERTGEKVGQLPHKFGCRYRTESDENTV